MKIRLLISGLILAGSWQSGRTGTCVINNNTNKIYHILIILFLLSIAPSALADVVLFDGRNAITYNRPAWKDRPVTTALCYLSGTGAGNTRTWEFSCSDGMRSGKWTTIEVPSQWEQQGFGAYTYGRFYLDKTAKPSDEIGYYRYTFPVSASWNGKSVVIVFEGAMTDTDVKINGKSAGEIHQGGFTQFSYDISDKLLYGKGNNLLEVKVSKESANESVNAAERRADWWLFGGIYRPVYLKIMPKMHIKRVGIDARANGRLTSTVHTANLKKGSNISVEVKSLADGKSLGISRHAITSDSSLIVTDWSNIKSWDCEHPNLYEATYTLCDVKGRPIHEHTERFGFRDIEFRPKDGIYLNGTKLLIKGVNRHCFHPETGRTLNRELSLEDARLIRQMNMNAVRSHYAPDRHFLEICDSLGLLYLDEFPGWHGKYDSQVGLKLLREHIARDANHPCIFMWSNGNEGGWNKNLDGFFATLDPQKRHVVHPWCDFNGIDTHHYPAYQTGPGKLSNGWKVFMPTEFLHSRYDKGAGSGLEDYWANYRSNPMFAGGFIWAFVDEAVKRTDKNGWLDSDGSNGCDGIVGPYREKEGSFFTIRDVWAPIQFAPLNITSSFNGKLLVSNEYLFTNFDECSMKYRIYQVSNPATGGVKTIMNAGDISLPSLAPGESGYARFVLPEGFFAGDILEVEMYDRNGESVVTHTWPIKFASEYCAKIHTPETAAFPKPTVTTDADNVTLSSSSTRVIFEKATGIITRIETNGQILPLSNGPIAVGMRAKVKTISTRVESDTAILSVKYSGGIDSIVWKLTPDGLLSMDAVILNKPNSKMDDLPVYDDKVTNLGLTFSYPEDEIKGMTWLGRGPYRVWKNRQRGANFGRWHKEYNNTVTGCSFESLIYPEFKGYHGSIYWAMLEGKKTDITIFSKTDGLYMHSFTPENPANAVSGDRIPSFPEGDISFLIDINAMQSFKPVSEHGPHSQPSTVRIKPGDEGVTLSLIFKFSPIDNHLTEVSSVKHSGLSR